MSDSAWCHQWCRVQRIPMYISRCRHQRWKRMKYRPRLPRLRLQHPWQRPSRAKSLQQLPLRRPQRLPMLSRHRNLAAAGPVTRWLPCPLSKHAASFSNAQHIKICRVCHVPVALSSDHLHNSGQANSTMCTCRQQAWAAIGELTRELGGDASRSPLKPPHAAAPVDAAARTGAKPGRSAAGASCPQRAAPSTAAASAGVQQGHPATSAEAAANHRAAAPTEEEALELEVLPTQGLLPAAAKPSVPAGSAAALQLKVCLW